MILLARALAAGTVVAMLMACGTEVVVRGHGGGTGGGGSDPDPPPTIAGQPPRPPTQGAMPDGPGHVYAVSRLFLGGTDRNGAANPSAWKQYGFNLDGKVSTGTSSDVCIPAAGGPKSVHQDGANGIDNAWGKQLFPIFQGLTDGLEMQVNQAILDGNGGYLVEVVGLGNQANYLGLDARFYEAAPTPLPPLFDGSDVWPPTAESFAPGGLPLFTFPSSYVTSHVFVANPPGLLLLNLPSVGDVGMPIPIDHAILVMELSSDRSRASGGVIAGVIPTEALVDEFQKVAGQFDESLCGGSTFESLADQLRQASDILLDGSQDPTKTCDGISIGLGFEAVEVTLAAKATPVPLPPDPCAPPPPSP